jgi:hypothetical protein
MKNPPRQKQDYSTAAPAWPAESRPKERRKYESCVT